MDKSPVTRMLGGGRGSPLCRQLDRDSIDKIYKAMFSYNAIYLSSDDVDHVIKSPQSLDDYIIDLANDESCPRDPTTYSESINFRDLIERDYYTERRSDGIDGAIGAMRTLAGTLRQSLYTPYIEYRDDTGDLFVPSPAPSDFQPSPFDDMIENELERELRKHINELREARRRGRL